MSLAPLVLIVLMSGTAHAAVSPVSSGVQNFSVLAGSTITNTGSSVIGGDLGLSPGTAVTGFPPGVVQGAQHIADTVAVQIKTALGNAYNDAAGRTPVSTIPAQLGGSTLHGGVYNSADGTFALTGTVTLDAQGDPNTLFIFKTGSTLTTAGASTVVLAGGAQACNVLWQVGSSATLGANSNFKGNILALTSVTLTTGANVEGGVFAQNGAVTLDANTITRPACVAAPTPIPTVASTTPVTTSTATTTISISSTPTTTPAVTSPVTPVLPTVPTLPNTGFGPGDSNGLWNALVVFAGAVVLTSFLIFRRKTVTSR